MRQLSLHPWRSITRADMNPPFFMKIAIRQTRCSIAANQGNPEFLNQSAAFNGAYRYREISASKSRHPFFYGWGPKFNERVVLNATAEKPG